MITEIIKQCNNFYILTIMKNKEGTKDIQVVINLH